jgi:glutamate N-acetyltransferase / amino-acid N-acetyltransferase
MSMTPIPKGFRFSALASGIKKSGKLDLALIVSDVPATCAGVFTQNRVVAAPVVISRKHIADLTCQAILVNSGNANACTGPDGYKVAEQTLQLAADALQLAPEAVAIASTGVIGVQLPLTPFESSIPELVSSLRPGQADDVAEAIRTTDAFVKIAAVEPANDHNYTLLGLAKGAGMIHPNMATMLGFILTDARVEPTFLDKALKDAVQKSFNSITVDRDTSTNDTVLLLANGCAENSLIEEGTKEADIFCRNLHSVLLDLAKMIVRDGEGATKLVQIKVTGAIDEQAARTAACSVATSALVKTAFFGEDANWGRIIAAVGYSGIDVDPDRIDINFGGIAVTRNGITTGPEKEAEATAVLKLDEFVVTIDLNQGEAESSYYTSDLGYEYIKINADYRT